MWSLTFRFSRSLKVIGTETDRSATYDFLLMSVSNCGRSLSRTAFPRLTATSVKKISKFGRKWQFFHTRVLNAPRSELSLKLCYPRGIQKLQWWGNQGNKKCDILSGFDKIHERVGQTDGEAPVDGCIIRLRIASRGKKVVVFQNNQSSQNRDQCFPDFIHCSENFLIRNFI